MEWFLGYYIFGMLFISVIYGAQSEKNRKESEKKRDAISLVMFGALIWPVVLIVAVGVTIGERLRDRTN